MPRLESASKGPIARRAGAGRAGDPLNGKLALAVRRKVLAPGADVSTHPSTTDIGFRRTRTFARLGLSARTPPPTRPRPRAVAHRLANAFRRAFGAPAPVRLTLILDPSRLVSPTGSGARAFGPVGDPRSRLELKIADAGDLEAAMPVIAEAYDRP